MTTSSGRINQSGLVYTITNWDKLGITVTNYYDPETYELYKRIVHYG